MREGVREGGAEGMVRREGGEMCGREVRRDVREGVSGGSERRGVALSVALFGRVLRTLGGKNIEKCRLRAHQHPLLPPLSNQRRCIIPTARHMVNA